MRRQCKGSGRGAQCKGKSGKEGRKEGRKEKTLRASPLTHHEFRMANIVPTLALPRYRRGGIESVARTKKL
jgi:hypothetical protein